jgi:hypothetical protein
MPLYVTIYDILHFMKIGSGKAWARTIGSAFAHLQHGLDKSAEWGFAKMKDVSSTPKKKDTTKNKYLRSSKTIARNTFSFFGQLGESFYNEYEDLKKKD